MNNDVEFEIHLVHLKFQFFRNEVQPFYGNYDCIQILARESQKRLLCTHIPTRLCRYLVKELYFSLSSYTGIQFLKFNTDSTEWEIFKKIKVGKNRDFGSVFIDGKLYVIGGNSTGSPISKVSESCERINKQQIYSHRNFVLGDFIRFKHGQHRQPAKYARSAFKFHTNRHWKIHLRFRWSH